MVSRQKAMMETDISDNVRLSSWASMHSIWRQRWYQLQRSCFLVAYKVSNFTEETNSSSIVDASSSDSLWNLNDGFFFQLLVNGFVQTISCCLLKTFSAWIVQ